MFWDSSAIVPLLLPEDHSTGLAKLLGGNGEMTIWWATPVECLSAIHRRHREGRLSATLRQKAIDRIGTLSRAADTVLPSTSLRERAGRLLAVHPLRAADAFQLAAALIACEEKPGGEVFVCLDERLSDAARKEGFVVEGRSGEA